MTCEEKNTAVASQRARRTGAAALFKQSKTGHKKSSNKIRLSVQRLKYLDHFSFPKIERCNRQGFMVITFCVVYTDRQRYTNVLN